MYTVKFVVYGEPIAKQSVKRGKTWHGQTVWYIPPKMSAWQNYITLVAGQYKPECPLDGPLELRAVFYLPRPKSRQKDVIWADRKPDVDNLLKPLKDALQSGGIIKNDSRLVRIFAEKLYGDPPRVEISVKKLKG